MTNYQSALERVKRANSVHEIERLEQSLSRVYDAGQLTERELARLFVKTFEKLATLN